MVAGNEFSGATAFAECFANVFASVFAKAAAEAAATAQCFDNGGDAAATASILAVVEADVFEYESCYIAVEETGTADGSVANSFTGTFVVCIPGCPTLAMRQLVYLAHATPLHLATSTCCTACRTACEARVRLYSCSIW